jgi:SAM-dependent methyltransferase
MYSGFQEAVDCPRGDVILRQDKKTGLVFNSAFRPELVVYDEDYQNEQGHSRVFQQHLLEVMNIIKDHLRGKSILEIGCGKGNFLELLKANGFSITGIDPAYEGELPHIIKEPFSPALGMKGDAIILRHVLEHINNPLDFLRSISETNGRKGIVYIEVPCLDWIIERRAWFDVFYEHVNYFRLTDFSRIFGAILDSGRLFGGQYIYVVADLSSLISEHHGDFDEVRFPDDFVTGLNRVIMDLKNRGDQKVILWGAASKGVIFAIQLWRRGGIKPDLVVDINPAKQGKYLPVTGLKVTSPESSIPRFRPGDIVLIMNSNYFSEIVEAAGKDLTYYMVDGK